MEDISTEVVIEEPVYDVEMAQKALDFIDNYRKMNDEILERLLKKYDKIAFEEFNQLCRQAIDDFYDDRDPWVYKRKEGLYTAFEVTAENGRWYVDHEPEMLDAGYHQSNEIIFNNVFMLGFHGGSKGTDKRGVTARVPKWRTPVPKYTRWKRGAADQAEQSPFDAIQEMIPPCKKRIVADLQKEYDEEIHKLNQELRSIIEKVRIK